MNFLIILYTFSLQVERTHYLQDSEQRYRSHLEEFLDKIDERVEEAMEEQQQQATGEE